VPDQATVWHDADGWTYAWGPGEGEDKAPWRWRPFVAEGARRGEVRWIGEHRDSRHGWTTCAVTDDEATMALRVARLCGVELRRAERRTTRLRRFWRRVRVLDRQRAAVLIGLTCGVALALYVLGLATPWAMTLTLLGLGVVSLLEE
jgi:hypothetical protein